MSYVGADVASLRNAAAQLRATADELDGHSQVLTGMLGSVHWLGDIASRLLSSWTGRHRVNLASTSQFFREAADKLDRNASEQEDASRSTGGAGSSPLARVLEATSKSMEFARQLIAEHRRIMAAGEEWYAASGPASLEAARAMSEADQRRWWDGLTEDQQYFLLASAGTAAILTTLSGLPSSVREQARRNYFEQTEDIPVGSSTDTLSIEGEVLFLEFGADAHASVTQMANGDYVVELSLGGELGGNIGHGASVSAGRTGQVTAEYVFSSKEQADEFLAGLYESMRPDGVSVLGGAGGMAASAAANVAEYLDGYHARSFEISTGVYGKVEGDIGALEGHAQIEGTIGYDIVTQETTVSVEAGGSLEFDVGDFESEGSVDFRSDLVFHDGQLKEIRIEGSIQAEAGFEVEGLLEGFGGDLPDSEFEATGGVSGRVEMRIDATDPAVSAAAAEYAAASARGDGAAASAALRSMYERAEVIVQVDTLTASEAEYGGVGAKVEYRHENRTNQLTMVKTTDGVWVKR